MSVSELRKVSAEELREVLAQHRKWLRGEDGGKRANLRSADLRSANLHGANLHGADLYGADLHGANLHGANLYGADLRSANLYGADLHGANLYGADLHGANLHGADLRPDANLTGEQWSVYLHEVVPALCTAGGHALEEVAAVWDCHKWDNCPMAVAFDVHSLDQVPPLHRPRAEQFVRLFDAGLIPNPLDQSVKHAQ